MKILKVVLKIETFKCIYNGSLSVISISKDYTCLNVLRKIFFIKCHFEQKISIIGIIYLFCFVPKYSINTLKIVVLCI